MDGIFLVFRRTISSPVKILTVFAIEIHTLNKARYFGSILKQMGAVTQSYTSCFYLVSRFDFKSMDTISNDI